MPMAGSGQAKGFSITLSITWYVRSALCTAGIAATLWMSNSSSTECSLRKQGPILRAKYHLYREPGVQYLTDIGKLTRSDSLDMAELVSPMVTQL